MGVTLKRKNLLLRREAHGETGDFDFVLVRVISPGNVSVHLTVFFQL